MITTEQVKELRDKTGISIMQCRKALEEADGDVAKALVILQKKSGEIANKKNDRQLGSGTVQSYIHGQGNLGAIVELSSETDFVSKNEEFRQLAYDIAMQVAATNPLFLKFDDITEESKKTATAVFEKEVEGKPEEMKAKILEGKLAAYFKEHVLLEQTFIKDPEVTIGELISRAVQKFGERIEIRRFVRFSTDS